MNRELMIQFGEYTDQADLLVRRIRNGQPWEDFIAGIDGAPADLRKAPYNLTPLCFVEKG